MPKKGMIRKRKDGMWVANEMKMDQGSDFVAVKALEDGVNIIGLTRGGETRFHHTEKLDRGEVYLAQFTENTSAMKVRGRCTIYCRYGIIEAGE